MLPSQPVHGLPLDGDRRGLGGGQGDGEGGAGRGPVRLGDRGGVGDGDDHTVVVFDGADGGGVHEPHAGVLHQLHPEGLVYLGDVVLVGVHRDGLGHLSRGEDDALKILYPLVVQPRGGGVVFRHVADGDGALRRPGQGEREAQRVALVGPGVGDGQVRTGVVVADGDHRDPLVQQSPAVRVQMDGEHMVRLVHLILQGGDGVGSAVGLARSDGHCLGQKAGVIGARLGHGGPRGVACAVHGLDGESHALGNRLAQGHREFRRVALGDVFPFSGYV